MSALVEARIKSFGLGRGWKSGVSPLGDGATAPARRVARGLGLAQVAQAQEWWQEVRELLLAAAGQ